MAEDYLHLITLAFRTQGMEAAVAKAKEYGVSIKGVTRETWRNAEGTEKATKEIWKIVPATSAAGKKTNDFMNAMRRAAIVAPVWMLLRNVMMFTFNTLKEGFNFWRKTEDAIAQIRIASNSTKEEVNGLANSVIGLSVALGISAIEGLKAAKIFAQQGLTIQETFAMTRAAMIGAKVLEEDVATTAETLTSAIRAYNLSFSEGIGLVDKWMGVQRQFAVTAKDLAEATKVAGAAASGLGISYDAFLGNVTAIIETTRKSGSQAGNALQMIYSRLFTMGKDVIQTIGKVPVYLDAVDKATFQNTYSMRSMEAVLMELSLKWRTLDKDQRTQLATIIGSRRQLTPFMALMNAYPRSIQAQITAVSSAGEAYRAINILLETTNSKLTQLNSTWLSFTQSLSQTSAFKEVLGFTKNLIQGFQRVFDWAGVDKANFVEDTSQDLLIREQKASEYKSLLNLYNLREEMSKQKLGSTIPLEYDQYLTQIDEILNKNEKFRDSLGATTKETKSNLEEMAKITEILKIKETLKLADPDIFLGASDEKKKIIEEGLLATAKEQYQAQQDLIDLKRKHDKLNEDEEKILIEEKMLLDHNVELLKIKGATEKQILDYKIQQITSQQLLNSEDKDQLKLKELQYEKERLITKEKLNQQSLTSDQAKIYKVSQKYGMGVAEDIAGALMGKWGGIKGLGGQSLEVFKTEFASEWENYMGGEFFKDNNYLRNLMTPTPTIPWENRLKQGVSPAEFSKWGGSPMAGSRVASGQGMINGVPINLNIPVSLKGGDSGIEAIKKETKFLGEELDKILQKELNTEKSPLRLIIDRINYYNMNQF